MEDCRELSECGALVRLRRVAASPYPAYGWKIL